jgi:hypothetical protein
LDEYTDQNQRVLGAQLGEDVGCHVVVVAYVVKLDPFEVAFKLAHFGAVCIHRIFFGVASLVDLVDDDLGVAVSHESFDPQGDSDAQPMDEGFILSVIVRRLVLDL